MSNEKFAKWFSKLPTTEEVTQRANAKCLATKKSCKKNFFSIQWNNESRGVFLNLPVMYTYLAMKWSVDGWPKNDVRLHTSAKYLGSGSDAPVVPGLVGFTICKKASDFDEYLSNEGQAVNWEYWNGLMGHTCIGEPKKRKRKEDGSTPKKEEKQTLEPRKFYLAKRSKKSFVEIDNEKANKKLAALTNSKNTMAINVIESKCIVYGFKAEDPMSDDFKPNALLGKLGVDEKEFAGAGLVFVTKKTTV